jgi:hypothetical protein
MYGLRTVDSTSTAPRFELHDLASDPWETNNVATSSEHQNRLERLQKKPAGVASPHRRPVELKWRYE